MGSRDVEQSELSSRVMISCGGGGGDRIDSSEGRWFEGVAGEVPPTGVWATSRMEGDASIRHSSSSDPIKATDLVIGAGLVTDPYAGESAFEEVDPRTLDSIGEVSSVRAGGLVLPKTSIIDRLRLSL
jgi:hypothetical protein